MIAVIVVGVLLFYKQNYDNMALLAFCMLILSCSISNSLVNRIFKSQIWAKLGGVTFEMLLVHAPVIWVMNNLTRSIPLASFEKLLLAVAYIIVVVTVSFVLKYMNSKFKRIVN
jgi:peptidoglycan/LPS O-acetylase OafA/YrhL